MVRFADYAEKKQREKKFDDCTFLFFHQFTCNLCIVRDDCTRTPTINTMTILFIPVVAIYLLHHSNSKRCIISFLLLLLHRHFFFFFRCCGVTLLVRRHFARIVFFLFPAYCLHSK